MNKTAKIFLVTVAAGFAAASLASAHASDRGDYKSYAKEINGFDWDRACRGVSVVAVKDNGWKLHVKNFSNSIENMFLDGCDDDRYGVIDCQNIATVQQDDGSKDCRIDRLHYGRPDAAHPKAGLVLETVLLEDITQTKKGGLLGLGKRRERTCEDAYKDVMGGKHPLFNHTVNNRTCEGK